MGEQRQKHDHQIANVQDSVLALFRSVGNYRKQEGVTEEEDENENDPLSYEARFKLKQHLNVLFDYVRHQADVNIQKALEDSRNQRTLIAENIAKGI
ncbi:hypothetical protein Cva_00795 [Caedimonas varicaedens]|uniref:Uncharacterized protein n=1 Tax=Caedimonas varicaedens TaxID=1629334 RepID=A0A0K8MCF5_9PROT|nr:hypothetical protein Cva_00795 [Caedimonas varicaedens]